MPNQISPGVVAVEKSYADVIPAVSTSIGAFAGPFAWGPVEQPETISNEDGLELKFWRPTDDTFVSWFSVATYLAYSDHIKVVRVVGDKARNAAVGGVGAGLTLNVTTLNGQVSSVTVANGGSGYEIGDYVQIVGGLTPALLRVIDVKDTTGGVISASGLELLDNGGGYVNGLATTRTLGPVLVKNNDDFTTKENLAEVIARYPGSMGNSLALSIVRASEFDNWDYRARFVVPPAASTYVFSGDGARTTFALPGGNFPADAIVTANGLTLTRGTDPGQYEIVTGNLVIHSDTESFLGSGAEDEFTLVNTYKLSTKGALVKVEGAVVPLYEGDGPVPAGRVRVSDNAVTFGTQFEDFNGDSVTKTFTVVGKTGLVDAQVFVDGVAQTNTGVAAPDAAGEFRVVEVGGNTNIELFAAPGIGNANVLVKWGYVPTSAAITVEYGQPTAGVNNVKVFYNQTEVHAVVVDTDGKWTGTENSVMERYDFMSLKPDAKAFDGSNNYYIDRINGLSDYVLISAPLSSYGDKVLRGGVDDNQLGNVEGVTPAKLQNGYKLFGNKNEYDIAHVITGAADYATQLWIIHNLTEKRGDCVAYISPQMADVVNNKGRELRAILNSRRNLPSSSFATMDSNWMMVFDRFNNKYRWIPCNAASAGCYAQTHDNLDAWFSGAGLNRGRIKNAVRLAWNPEPAEMDDLYANGVNGILRFVNEGPVLYGDKTLYNRPDAFQSMNIRFLFVVLRKAITAQARYYLFENNTQYTRNRFKNKVSPFLRDVQGREGIEKYYVKCDENNNNATVRARKEFIADIAVRPVFSINFITLNFVAVSGDVEFTEVLTRN